MTKISEATKELLRLTTDLPEWAIEGRPAPATGLATATGCMCLNAGNAWYVHPHCPLHGLGLPIYAAESYGYVSPEERSRILQAIALYHDDSETPT